jgi:hypothetical protein
MLSQLRKSRTNVGTRNLSAASREHIFAAKREAAAKGREIEVSATTPHIHIYQ